MTIRYRTLRAYRLSSAIESCLLNSARLRFLVFGPAKGAEGYMTHRVAVQNKITSLGQIADFPEDLYSKKTENHLLKEFDLMQEYDCTVIVMISIGAIVEYVSFVKSKQVDYKIRLFVDEKHKHSQGFLALDLIEPFKRVYKQVFYFKHANHLLRQIKKMVRDMILLNKIQNI